MDMKLNRRQFAARAAGASALFAVGGLAAEANVNPASAADTYQPVSNAGPVAARPSSGTGSTAFYFATDENGGTLYQDLTDGGPYTKVSPGVTEPSGLELYYGEITTNESTTRTVGNPEPFSAADLTYTLTAQTRPVYAEIGCGVASNNTAGYGAAVHIGGSSNTTRYARSSGQSAAANQTFEIRAFKRFAPGVAGVIRGYKSGLGGAGTATLFGSFGPIYLRVWTG